MISYFVVVNIFKQTIIMEYHMLITQGIDISYIYVDYIVIIITRILF